MKFSNRDRGVTLDEVRVVEEELSLSFPDALKRLFLENNGGEPDPYSFEGIYIVNECLPLRSNRRRTAVESYRLWCLERELVPRRYFPFAVDGGGSTFFVDCESRDAEVHNFHSDAGLGHEERLESLKLGLDSFWERLSEPEEE